MTRWVLTVKIPANGSISIPKLFLKISEMCPNAFIHLILEDEEK